MTPGIHEYEYSRLPVLMNMNNVFKYKCVSNLQVSEERTADVRPTRVCRLLPLSPRWRRGLVPRLPALLWARGGSPPRF